MVRDMTGTGRYPPQPKFQPFAFYSCVRLGDPEQLKLVRVCVLLCVCMCMCLYVFVCVFLYVFVCVFVYVTACLFVCLYVCVMCLYARSAQLVFVAARGMPMCTYACALFSVRDMVRFGLRIYIYIYTYRLHTLTLWVLSTLSKYSQV
jgi:hypothetical protein